MIDDRQRVRQRAGSLQFDRRRGRRVVEIGDHEGRSGDVERRAAFGRHAARIDGEAEALQVDLPRPDRVGDRRHGAQVVTGAVDEGEVELHIVLVAAEADGGVEIGDVGADHVGRHPVIGPRRGDGRPVAQQVFDGHVAAMQGDVGANVAFDHLDQPCSGHVQRPLFQPQFADFDSEGRERDPAGRAGGVIGEILAQRFGRGKADVAEVELRNDVGDLARFVAADLNESAPCCGGAVAFERRLGDQEAFRFRFQFEFERGGCHRLGHAFVQRQRAFAHIHPARKAEEIACGVERQGHVRIDGRVKGSQPVQRTDLVGDVAWRGVFDRGGHDDVAIQRPVAFDIERHVAETPAAHHAFGLGRQAMGGAPEPDADLVGTPGSP